MAETRKPRREMLDITRKGMPPGAGIKPPEHATALPPISEGPESVPGDVKAQQRALDAERVLAKARQRAERSRTDEEQDRAAWEEEKKHERVTDQINEEVAADEAVKRKLLK